MDYDKVPTKPVLGEDGTSEYEELVRFFAERPPDYAFGRLLNEDISEEDACI